MSEIEFEYRLVGTGWSEARFAVGDRWVGLTASYLEDALGDLLIFDESRDFRAFVRAIAAGARRVLEVHGEAGYREKWVDHPFPTEHLLALEGAVA